MIPLFLLLPVILVIYLIYRSRRMNEFNFEIKEGGTNYKLIIVIIIIILIPIVLFIIFKNKILKSLSKLIANSEKTNKNSKLLNSFKDIVGEYPIGCTDEYDKISDKCYKKCPNGYERIGNYCYIKGCPPNTTENGIMCEYNTEFPREGNENPMPPDGWEYYTGDIFKKKCDTGYTYIGSECYNNSMEAKCPNGWHLLPNNMCIQGYIRELGKVPTTESCASGQRDDGTNCWEDLKCVKGAGCKGCGCIKKTLLQRQSCSSNEQNVEGQCYKNCRNGFKPHPNYPSICIPINSSVDNLKSIADVGICPDGSTLNGTVCYKGSGGVLSYIPDMMTFSEIGICPQDKENINGYCYNKCPEGTEPDGLLCKRQKLKVGEIQNGYKAIAPNIWEKQPIPDTGVPLNKCDVNKELKNGTCYKKNK